MSETKESLRAELAQAKRDIKDWQDSSEAYRQDAGRTEAECKAMLESEDKLIRTVIDETWGEAFEDGSVPSTKLQDKIIAKARAALNPSPADPE